MLRRLAALALPLALACGDDGRDSTATAAATLTPGTTEPGLTTSEGDPTATGTTGTTDATTAPPATTGPTTGPVLTSTTDPGPCPEDQIVCEGATAKVCDGMGGFKGEEACPVACAPGLGCTECVPGDSQCQGQLVAVCNDAGTGYEVAETCDPLLGLACDPQFGACVGACAGLGLSYIGCDYYASVTQQNDAFDNPPHEFAVAVANTSGEAATVTVTRGAAMVTQVTVPAMSVQIVPLPWVPELTDFKDASMHVVDGAYRLRSTRPVTVYQYNPIGATVSNDASLLLPVNTWTGNYLVASWPTWDSGGGSAYPGWYAVVAREDNTTVTLNPSATGKLVVPGAGVAADGSGVVTLDADDVLQVLAAPGGDLTGTIIHADRPIEVFGGHECTNVPADVGACDHLEEAIFPIETLAKEYVVVPPVQVPDDNLDKAQMVRIIASEANTTLAFQPDQPVAKNLAAAGDVAVSVAVSGVLNAGSYWYPGGLDLNLIPQ